MRLVLHAIDQPQEKSPRADHAHAARRRDGGRKDTAGRSPREQSDFSSTAVASKAEGTLAAEAEQIKEQVHEARPGGGQNLLSPEGDDEGSTAEDAA